MLSQLNAAYIWKQIFLPCKVKEEKCVQSWYFLYHTSDNQTGFISYISVSQATPDWVSLRTVLRNTVLHCSVVFEVYLHILPGTYNVQIPTANTNKCLRLALLHHTSGTRVRGSAPPGCVWSLCVLLELLNCQRCECVCVLWWVSALCL